MKKLYLFLNKHMHTLAVLWAACLLPVAVAPAFGWVVVGCIAALCILMAIGDYPKNWIQEVLDGQGCGGHCHADRDSGSHTGDRGWSCRCCEEEVQTWQTEK